jgi:hypothetical protein
MDGDMMAGDMAGMGGDEGDAEATMATEEEAKEEAPAAAKADDRNAAMMAAMGAAAGATAKPITPGGPVPPKSAAATPMPARPVRRQRRALRAPAMDDPKMAAAAAPKPAPTPMPPAAAPNATAAAKNATASAPSRPPPAFSGSPYVITVEKDKRYRLRLIAGTSSWALRVNVTGHNLTLIALDGRPIAARKADALVFTSGERADVVLSADRPIANYWIDISTLDGRNSPAILHYEGAPDPLDDAKFLSGLAYEIPGGCAAAGLGGRPGVVDLKNATGISAAAGVPAPPPGPADKAFTIYLADASSSVPPPAFLQHIAANNATRGNATMTGGAGVQSNIHGLTLRDGNIPAKGPSCPDGDKYCWSMNWNVYRPPQDDVPLLFGPKDSIPRPRTYTIDVNKGDVVDLVLINPSLMVHPMHLHGAGFWVLGQGNGRVVDADDRLSAGAAAKLNLLNAPVRDTVAVAQAAPALPSGKGDGATQLDPKSYGYAVLRFRADNPGPWAFHCHIDLHAGSGMFMAFIVHDKEKEEKQSEEERQRGAPSWLVPGNMDCRAEAQDASATSAAGHGVRKGVSAVLLMATLLLSAVALA